MTQSLWSTIKSEPLDSFDRKTIGEPERHKLRDVLGVKVRKVVPGVPALVLHISTLMMLKKTRHWSGAPPAVKMSHEYASLPPPRHCLAVGSSGRRPNQGNGDFCRRLLLV